MAEVRQATKQIFVPTLSYVLVASFFVVTSVVLFR